MTSAAWDIPRAQTPRRQARAIGSAIKKGALPTRSAFPVHPARMRYAILVKQSVALCPPKPSELLKPASMVISLAAFGT